MANSCNHLKALLKKNWILFKRSPCGSCCEIVTPIVFALFLLAVRSLVSKDSVVETSYYNKPHIFTGNLNISQQMRDAYSSIPDSAKTGFLDDFYKTIPIKNCLKMPRGGSIALSPQNDLTNKLKAKFDQIPGSIPVKFFNSLTAMNQYMESDFYGDDSYPYICLGVAFTSSGENNKYEYDIRFNTSNQKSEVYNTISSTVQTMPFVKQNFDNSDLFITSGFLTIQNWIDNIILEVETNDPNASIIAGLASVKIPAYLNDNISLYLQGQTNVFLCLPLILPFLRMIYRLLYEKEKKIREGMKMMGMTNTSFYASWVITYLIIYTIICFINAIILKAKFFTNSNGFLVFFFLWFFCVVLIFQALFVSVFFTRVKSGIIGGIVFFFVLYIINYTVITNTDITFDIKQQASLSSHAAMAFGAETMLELETNGVGLDSSTMKTLVNNYKMETYFAFEFINIIIFSIFSIYLDQVFPNEFGQKKHPLFFINWIWRRKNNGVKNNYEPPGGSPVDLEKNQLNVTTSDIQEPVDSTLKQQEAENQALLIKNLTKVYPTGKKAVDDLSLNMYQNQIFVLLGHNGAGKTTTISILTGMLYPTSGTASILGKDIRYDMENLRTKMGVCPQHDILFDTLTVEEHLRLFATFKGMKPADIPKEVDKIIDDVDLRPKRFDLAKNLSGGQKRRLSVGIAFIGNSKLILLDEPTSGMDTSARRYIWEMLKNYKNDRIVILTTHFMDEADFLGDRIAIMGDGVLKCCGSSVFLKNKFGVGYNLIIVKKTADPNPAIEEFVLSRIKTGTCISRVAAEVAFQLPLNEMSKFKELFNGLDENLQELKINSYGISITTLEEVFLKVAEGSDPSKKGGMKFNKEENENDLIDDFDLNAVKIKGKIAMFFVHFWALFIKRLQYFKRDKKGLCCEIFMPVAIVGVGLCITFIQFLYEAPPLKMSPEIFKLPIKIPVQNSYLSFYQSYAFHQNYYTFLPGAVTDVPSFDQFVFDERNIDENGLYGAYYIQQMNPTVHQYGYLAEYNSTTPFTLPILMNQMNQAIIRFASSKQQLDINCINYPFPLTSRIKSVSGTANGFIAVFIFSIAFAFIPASLIVFIVKERNQSIKHQQLVSGVSLLSYWMANFFLDFLKLTIPLIFSVLMCEAFGISTLTDPSESYGAVWLIFIFYSMALITFTYFISFLFKDYGNAQAFSFVFFFLISAVGSLVIFVLRLVPSSRDGAKIAQYFLRLFPPFAFGYGILNVSNRAVYALVEKYYVSKGAFDTDIAAWDIIYLAIESLAYMLLVFIIEKLLVMPKFLTLFTRETSVAYEQIKYDDDVEAEMKKIETANASEYSVFVKDLRKVYMLGGGKKKVAVTKTSFGIQNGECFGLLGVNGAGKTTTFKMLCGEIPPSSGTAYINGFDVRNQLDLAREHIGYCPQFDALLENLTAKEHLFLYAAIKGIPYNMRKDLVEKKLVEMNLKKYENICAGTYSGGNKRKLSVAIAMLGNPPIVFLDEPSTGMDPEARRFMWDVISRISTSRKRSSIILTTHSMEEAEALSSRISIMVNGTLKCLGSVQHIKNKFGKGYEIEIKTILPEHNRIDAVLSGIQCQRGQRLFAKDLQNVLARLNKPHFYDNFQNGKSASHLAIDLLKQNGLAIEVLVEYVIIEDFGTIIMNFLNKEYGSYTVLEHFQSFYRFKLNANVSIGKLFGGFEDNKINLNISQYSIKQATIEQIFNMFANEQDNELAEYQEAQELHKKHSVLQEIEMEKIKMESSGGPLDKLKIESESHQEPEEDNKYKVVQIRPKS